MGIVHSHHLSTILVIKAIFLITGGRRVSGVWPLHGPDDQVQRG